MFRKTDAEMRVRHRLMTHPQENSCICLHMQLIAILSRIGVIRVPSGKRDIQEELRELIHVQEILGSDKCSWSVIEDIYNQTRMQVGILAY